MGVLNCSYLLSNYLSYTQYDFVIAVLLVVASISFLRLKLNRPAILLLFVGGAANLISRQFINHGCVYDNINFFGLFHNNFYDLLVCAGIVGLVYDNYLRRQ